jgi:hypothetical protein
MIARPSETEVDDGSMQLAGIVTGSTLVRRDIGQHFSAIGDYQ